jgi:hypothetical protein
MVQNLAAAGVDRERIAAAIGLKRHETLVKYYKSELAVSQTQVTAMAQSQLFAAIKRGELAAIFFWLKTRERWHETAAHRFVDEEGKDRPVESKIVNLSTETLLRIAEELEAKRAAQFPTVRVAELEVGKCRVSEE